MAGGNKGHSPKVKKRQIQEQAKAFREAAEKKRRRPAYSGASPATVTTNTVPGAEMPRSQFEAYSGRVTSVGSQE